jgi:hypothetical protein
LSRLIPSNRLAAPYRVVSPSIGLPTLLSETIGAYSLLVSFFWCLILQSCKVSQKNEIVIVIVILSEYHGARARVRRGADGHADADLDA